MSSHHIVRDEQEPAIVIADIQRLYWSAINQLLGWVPTIVVAEECIKEVLLQGIKVDVVICDQKNLTSVKELLKDQTPIKFLVKEKETVISVAVNYLQDKGYKGVNIFGAFDKQNSLTINENITAIWYDSEHRHVLSSERKFHKWMVSNQEFSLLPTKEGQSFKVKNSKKATPNGSYVSQQDGMVTIDSDADFWIGEKY